MDFVAKVHQKKGMKLTEGSRKSIRIKGSEKVEKQLICYCRYVNCPVCNKNFTYKDSLFHHLETQHKWTSEDKKQLMYECSLCKVLYWKRTELEAHITNKHIKQFKCSECSVSFKVKSSLKAHNEYIHKGKEKEQCQICYAKFEGQNRLKKHIASKHEGKKPHLCTICGYSAALSSRLRNHNKSMVIQSVKL